MSNSPPENNPILTAYESFQSNTPLVTRYMLTTLALSFVVSFFFDPGYALSNIPLFTIHRFELYRIVTCNLICTQMFSLIFSFMSFTDNAKRLEYSMGSSAFLGLILTIGCLSNCFFLAFCELLYLVTREQSCLFQSASGIWIILLGIIAIECANAPVDSQRRLFFFEIQTRYYPILLLLLFSLMGGPRLPWCFSVGIGYAYGYGYFDFLKLSPETCRRWEDGCLRNFTTRNGWVTGHAATGVEAWSNSSSTSAPTNNSESGGSIFPANIRSRFSADSSASTNAKTDFPSSGGRTLGSASSRTSSADARAARLAALEERRNNDDPENNI